MGNSNDKTIIIPFASLREDDIDIIGTKSSNLGKLYSKRVPVPNGFVITFNAFDFFISSNKINEQVRKLCSDIDPLDSAGLENISNKLKRAVLRSNIFKDLADEITKSYTGVSGFSDAYVAVRSSLPQIGGQKEIASGDYPTFLNVRGKSDVLEKVKAVWASVYSPQSLFKALSLGIDISSLKIAVVVQKMVQSEVSGIIFTQNPIDSDDSLISIEAVLGLGEALVQGRLNPDNYLVEKETLAIKDKRVVPQEWMLVRKGRAKRGEDPNVTVNVSEVWKERQKLEDNYIKNLAKIAKTIESEFQVPQEIEWAYEGGRVWIVQSRDMTKLSIDAQDLWKKTPTFAALKAKVESQKPTEKKKFTKRKFHELFKKQKKKLKPKEEKEKQNSVLLNGRCIYYGLVSAPVQKISSVKEAKNMKPGNIAVISELTKEFAQELGSALGVIADKSSTKVDTYDLARKLAVPIVVDTKIATKILRDGEMITLKGDTGEVLIGTTADGIIAAQKLLQRKNLVNEVYAKVVSRDVGSKYNQNLDEKIETTKTATKLYVSLNSSENVLEVAKIDVDGVGYLNFENIILENSVHPLLAHKHKSEMRKLVNNLSLNLFSVAKAFNPRPVIYKFSDLLTSELASLDGGKEFETQEFDPLMGLRGASRFVANPEYLVPEVEAIKNVRNKENLRNIEVAVPFVRSSAELKEVKRSISAMGLRRSSTLKIYSLIQVPSAAFNVKKLIDVGIDGVIIDFDSLAQTTFAVEKLSEDFGSGHPAILELAEKIITECGRGDVDCIVVGKGVATDPKVIEKLVKWGISAVSVTPDVSKQAYETLFEAERKLIVKKN